MIELIVFNKGGEIKEYRLDDKTLIDLGFGAITLTSTNKVCANQINQALMPLVYVLQDLSEPISYGFMVKGFLQIMAGDEHAGQKTIKSAIGGFLGIQFIPKIFQIIKNIRM